MRGAMEYAKKPLVVAEIGINHNGDLSIAKSLIALSSCLGADYVKFQKRTPELCVPDAQKNVIVSNQWGTMTYLDYKRKIEFGRDEYDELDAYCKHMGIGWFASVWDSESAEFMARYECPFLKVASACITDLDLLKAIKRQDTPVVLSTGMSDKAQIDRALSVLGGQVGYLLHCTSAYPLNDRDVNMRKLLSLRELYGDRHKIGFSNHSSRIVYVVQAYVMGAEMVEFHITLDRNMQGSDHAASIDPGGFDRIMKHIDSIHTGWGTGEIRCLESEIPVRDKLRRF